MKSSQISNEILINNSLSIVNQDEPENYFAKLPDEVILQIFEYIISNERNAASLYFVDRKFREMFKFNSEWIENKNSFIEELTKIKDNIKEVIAKIEDKREYYDIKLQILIKFLEVFPDDNEIEKQIMEILPNISYDYLNNRQKLFKIYLHQNEIKKATDLMKQMDSFSKVIAQIELLKKNPDDGEIESKLISLIDKMDQINFENKWKDIKEDSRRELQISVDRSDQEENKNKGVLELFKLYLHQNEIKKATAIISKMNLIEFKMLAQIELLKKNPDDDEIESKFISLLNLAFEEERYNVFFLAQRELFKIYLQQNKIKKALDLEDQMILPVYMALAHIEYVKVFPDDDEIQKILNFIDEITLDFQKKEAVVKLFEAFPNNVKIEKKAKEICLTPSLSESGEDQLKLLNIYIKQNKIKEAEDYVEQIPNVKVQYLAKIKLIKIYVQQNIIKEANDFINQINAINVRALAKIKLLKSMKI
ncbi:MAG: hypothetical protein K940chlam5_01512 [Candidatus Anoxychlamydiales bacterium]|nr:hypothetical protein [Candidatus Anoxychlamydiales bacterium]